MPALVLHVRLHDGRYHGEGDWPPSPARLFQALVAGAGLGGPLAEAEKAALEWLESQPPPVIAAPLAWQPRRGVLLYMPNNDSDAIGGDPSKNAKIRTATKVFRPRFFDAGVPFVYAWPLRGAAGDEDRARVICSLAEGLYQLGRGIDIAWAWGEFLDDHELDDLLAEHPGRLLRPSAGTSATTLPCPCPGSLRSLELRHEAFGKRFDYNSVSVVFRTAPRPVFRQTPYESPPSRQVYELRSATAEGAFVPWPLTHPTALVVELRDAAVGRLKKALPGHTADIDRVLVGRKPDGSNDGRPEDRVRIVPLPSIGHVHADREIRRILVEVPATCPLRADDVHWAFSGLEVVDAETGEIKAVLIRAGANEFLCHYGVSAEGGHRVWRTVTPAALPERARRRRIDPRQRLPEAKAGEERSKEILQAAVAVRQALRHAGVRSAVETIRLQREPFEGKGARAEAFARGTRFDERRLWHVEIVFAEPLAGSLVIGDGRFFGLGVMAPVSTVPGIHAFAVEAGLVASPDPLEITRAFRRAVMARVQEALGPFAVPPPFFTGHGSDGAPARSEEHPHLFFLFVPDSCWLMVVAPHVIERRQPSAQEREHLDLLDKALSGMSVLRAGRAGCLCLQPIAIDPETDPLFGSSRVWDSVTPYTVTRHLHRGSAAEALAADLLAECNRRGLPRPLVEPREWRAEPGTGLRGHARLVFPVPVPGPLLLGRTRHLGGGVFVGMR